MDSSRRSVVLASAGQPIATQDSAGPMSPCVSICTLDPNGVCRGCFRTLAEISGWLRMSADDRHRVLRSAELRRTAAAV